MAQLIVDNAHKSFGDTRALTGMSFEVEDGEFYSLIGPSAAGKTTTLRAIAGLEKLDSGTVTFAGEDFTDAPVQGRPMAMIFQTFALYPHMTIRENLAFPLRQHKVERVEVDRRVNEIGELLKLSHALDRKPGTASGGEQQRIAIGRALIRQPQLLLMDEPLTNLDAKLRHDTRAEFKRLHRERNITIIYATPDELEALTMGERIGVMEAGHMVQVGSPDEVYESPDNAYVAGMIGSPRLNLINGSRKGSDVAPSVAVPFGEYAGGDWNTALKEFPVGTEITFGIRPHEIVPVRNDEEITGPTFESEVHLIEPIGDVVILDLDASGTKLQIVLPEEEAIAYRQGDHLTCRFDIAKTHVFAKETGTVIR